MTDGRTDGQTDGRTDGRTDGGNCNIPIAFLKKRGDKNPMSWPKCVCHPLLQSTIAENAKCREKRNTYKCKFDETRGHTPSKSVSAVSSSQSLHNSCTHRTS